MKYLDFVMLFMMLNLTISLIVQTGLLPPEFFGEMQSESPVDDDGQFLDQESLAYKVSSFDKDKYYLNSAQNLDQQYLQSGGDFIRGFYWFYDAFVKGTLLARDTLRNLGIPHGLIFYFTTPIYFMYAVAVIQLISGRSFSGND